MNEVLYVGFFLIKQILVLISTIDNLYVALRISRLLTSVSNSCLPTHPPSSDLQRFLPALKALDLSHNNIRHTRDYFEVRKYLLPVHKENESLWGFL